MYLKILLSLIVSATLAWAGQSAPKMHCTLIQEGPVTVHWKAYKTPAKVGVGGVFDKVDYQSPKKSGINFSEILSGATVTIDKKSVNSKNEGRDAKLVKFFFDQMKGDTITARIIDLQPGKRERGKPKTGNMTVAVTMNGITREVPMHYTYDQGTLEAWGVIDLFDFSASAALQSINKACFDLHLGKTWNDVTIGFTMRINALCEPVT